jgi:hypothetical protein
MPKRFGNKRWSEAGTVEKSLELKINFDEAEGKKIA